MLTACSPDLGRRPVMSDRVSLKVLRSGQLGRKSRSRRCWRRLGSSVLGPEERFFPVRPEKFDVMTCKAAKGVST